MYTDRAQKKSGHTCFVDFSNCVTDTLRVQDKIQQYIHKCSEQAHTLSGCTAKRMGLVVLEQSC